MKRLIRKSEFYKDLTDEEFTYFSYKNPISKEWNDLNKVYKGEKEIELKKYIRGIALENGDVYIIHADKIHEDMAKLLNIPDGLHFEGTNRYEMIIRLTPEMDIKYLKNIFNNCESLYNFYNKNTKLVYEGDIQIKVDNKNPTIKQILELKEDYPIGSIISLDGLLNIDYIRKNKNYLSRDEWAEISSYMWLTEEFIEEFKDKINWNLISYYQPLSEDFIEEFKDKIYFKSLKQNIKIDLNSFSDNFKEIFKEELYS